ncbi:FAS1 domain-containing protein [Lentithecium fluviatile CBS 122367]|uniref:FAS1 domain-containing protein n=1 Tax=Lentithecium fluviatile CBS 122367 TaxID=1168545 RepID=A0A6G1IDX4_9PLEO|nr:FAS1 domain-containing protein [Lentithecium fluviatile CBS 122367]
MLRTPLILFLAPLTTHAQTLYEALSKQPTLSNFTAFYQSNSAFASALFANKSNYPVTFLAPNDDAFASYQNATGTPLTDLPPETLLELVQYHTLVTNLSAENFTKSGAAGFTTPTLLTGEAHNNRSVGAALASKYGGPGRASGQVVFIKNADSGSSKARRFWLSTRQDGGAQNTVRSGLSSNVLITPLDDSEGTWEGGRFHIVDGLLTPPEMCSDTIRNAKLTGLDNALNRSGLWTALDSSKNVTCLGPNNKAFGDAGSPDAKLNETELAGALLFHTLPEVAYSDFLEDGQEFTSLQNGTVRVRVEGEGKERQIWFNNAKVVDANVLTHNGLMHVLDAVMVPLEQMNATTSATPSGTSSATASPTSSTSPSPAATCEFRDGVEKGKGGGEAATSYRLQEGRM